MEQVYTKWNHDKGQGMAKFELSKPELVWSK